MCAAVSPKQKGQAAAAAAAARDVALLLQTGVRGTMVGVQAIGVQAIGVQAIGAQKANK
jgi:hypothetical protein